MKRSPTIGPENPGGKEKAPWQGLFKARTLSTVSNDGYVEEKKRPEFSHLKKFGNVQPKVPRAVVPPKNNAVAGRLKKTISVPNFAESRLAWMPSSTKRHGQVRSAAPTPRSTPQRTPMTKESLEELKKRLACIDQWQAGDQGSKVNRSRKYENVEPKVPRHVVSPVKNICPLHGAKFIPDINAKIKSNESPKSCDRMQVFGEKLPNYSHVQPKVPKAVVPKRSPIDPPLRLNRRASIGGVHCRLSCGDSGPDTSLISSDDQADHENVKLNIRQKTVKKWKEMADSLIKGKSPDVGKLPARVDKDEFTAPAISVKITDVVKVIRELHDARQRAEELPRQSVDVSPIVDHCALLSPQEDSPAVGRKNVVGGAILNRSAMLRLEACKKKMEKLNEV